MKKPDTAHQAAWLAACLTALYTLCLLAISLWRNDGTFVYALDDPYIHLDLAKQIATTGVYGVNPGEISSPSSSILWPFLLVPFALTPFFVYMPFIIGLVSAAASAAVLVRLCPPGMNKAGSTALDRKSVV